MRHISTTTAALAAVLGVVITAELAIAQTNPTDPAGSYARKKNICYREGGLREN